MRKVIGAVAFCKADVPDRLIALRFAPPDVLTVNESEARLLNPPVPISYSNSPDAGPVLERR